MARWVGDCRRTTILLLAAARRRYAAWLEGEVRRLYLERAFDILVLPSDTFFYVRALPAAAHRLGIPVVVVQKETTVSEATMETFSREIRSEAPFISDFMTVCSARQREFWERAGATPDCVDVTGQPRFDIYASSAPTHHSAPRRVLFLSYALDAYVPGTGRGQGLRTWEPLRDATESPWSSSLAQGDVTSSSSVTHSRIAAVSLSASPPSRAPPGSAASRSPARTPTPAG